MVSWVHDEELLSLKGSPNVTLGWLGRLTKEGDTKAGV